MLVTEELQRGLDAGQVWGAGCVSSVSSGFCIVPVYYLVKNRSKAIIKRYPKVLRLSLAYHGTARNKPGTTMMPCKEVTCPPLTLPVWIWGLSHQGPRHSSTDPGACVFEKMC